MSYKIAIIYGSVRSSREGIKAAKFIERKVKEAGHKPTLIDPKEHKIPLLDKMYKEYSKGEAPTNLEKLHKVFKDSDGYIVVSAEYNHSPPPALLNLLDHFLEEYSFKPSAILSYSAGSFGGVRAATHLRDFLSELGMPSIPTSLAIGKIQSTIDSSGNSSDEKLNNRTKKFLSEFFWYVEALKLQREKGTPY